MLALESNLTSQPDFNQSVRAEAKTLAENAVSHSSGANSIEQLTLEFNSNPFKQFIKEVETLIETNPEEALRLIELAIDDSMGQTKVEYEKLTQKRDEIVERFYHNEMQEPNILEAPALTLPAPAI